MVNGSERHAAHGNQGDIEVLVLLPGVVGVVSCRLFLVHCVEIETSVIVLDELEIVLRAELHSFNGVLLEMCGTSNAPLWVKL